MLNKDKLIKSLNLDYIKEEHKILEMAYAVDGDFNFGNQLNVIINRFDKLSIEDKNKSIVGSIFIDKKQFNIHIVGEFVIVSRDLKCVNITGIKHIKFNKNLSKIYKQHTISINAMQTDYKFRKKGIAKSLIKFLIEEGLFIMGDSIEYENARKMWLSINRIDDYVMDIINIEEDKVLYKNIKLEDIYDSRIWVLNNKIRNKDESFWERLNNIILNTRAIIYKRN